jgi:hypothetical protein
MFETVTRGSSGITRAVSVVVADRHTEPLDGSQLIPRANLGGILDRASDVWPDTYVNRELLARVLEEASSSHAISGTSPEMWSPLGRSDVGPLEELTVEEDLLDRWLPRSARLAVDISSPDSPPIVGLSEGPLWIGAAALSSDALLVPVPEGTEWIDVLTDPAGSGRRVEHHAIESGLRDRVDGRVHTNLLWRLYLGSNTLTFDGITPARRGWHRIPVPRFGPQPFGVGTAGCLVARVLKTVHRKTSRDQPDPSATRRRVKHERRMPVTAVQCPDIRLVYGHVPSAIVAVHGTMSSGLALASVLDSVAVPGVHVLRFEHDTWLPIGRNANELVNELRRLGTRQVLFVGHSRGGLVSRHAQRLAEAQLVEARTLALGTPFAGTPIVGNVEVGLMGTRALLGALRLAGDPFVIDPATRIAGWVIRSELPEGIRAMADDSQYLSGAQISQDRSNISAFAGRVELLDTHDSYGIELAHGFARGNFGMETNDLVVSEHSACSGAQACATISCDHFSFLLQDEVKMRFAREAQWLRLGPVVLDAEVPHWLHDRANR